ncbi:sulfotransferase family 2 domain-containing protein [Paraglaciecola sp.]|uniref:sulfotransferase family 2 domain-containing protein n=1 Tax=Paraglaciecola sp. TaxID=1920173 RepID=UPI00273FAE3A|nr:sulfotransferase family 2 domain-containing protein [Paraglaciecola sp.]MDP5030969.1 sulfotransferase family protein [Paraglaciecola sp.]
MISHKHKCIFVHIPKCAGTSIENILGHFDGHEGRAGQDHRSIRMIEQPGLQLSVFKNADNIKDYIRRVREGFRSQANPNNGLTVNAKQYQEYFKFTVVRNPWHRALSWYKNVLRDEIHQKNYGINPNLSFEQFITQFAGTGYLRPQTYWLKEFNGKINLDYVVKFENLAEDYMKAAELGNLPNVPLPHKIEGEKGNFDKNFTQNAINFIADFYKEEIQLFQYKF